MAIISGFRIHGFLSTTAHCVGVLDCVCARADKRINAGRSDPHPALQSRKVESRPALDLFLVAPLKPRGRCRSRLTYAHNGMVQRGSTPINILLREAIPGYNLGVASIE